VAIRTIPNEERSRARRTRRALLPLALAATIALVLTGENARATTQLLLVHGYADSRSGADCNDSTWKDALRYYENAGGLRRSSMSTIGYYGGDRSHCDVMVGDGSTTNATPIQDVAADLAWYVFRTYTEKGKPVNVIAHSMGGLVTRVALLGAAQGWAGFPPKLNVTNVVTLGTPHQGVLAPRARADRQWQQMNAGSAFMSRLHQVGSGLGDAWAAGTDWSLVGSAEDQTVSYNSAIDKGSHADQKFGYRANPDDAGTVTHAGIRTLYGHNQYDLNYWHAAGGDRPHHTLDGWAPLKTAFQAATEVGDGLPR
jgi:pimeloyl-ACP methyl ester carboxylesterase